jgi:hypothetical protein
MSNEEEGVRVSNRDITPYVSPNVSDPHREEGFIEEGLISFEIVGFTLVGQVHDETDITHCNTKGGWIVIKQVNIYN